jgi:hypothetical protein
MAVLGQTMTLTPQVRRVIRPPGGALDHDQVLRPVKGAVSQLVTMIACGYLGQRVWNPGLPAWVG